jgi:putative Mg2+ transporter-C (MgtC) family protein
MVEAGNCLLALGTATFFGSLIGLNRQMHRKPAGMRTHALVALGAAMAAVMILNITHGDANAASRVLQGVVTGIGFLGAGVIMHHDADSRVEGLTTAASVWIAAMIGLACGLGLIFDAAVAIAITMFVLITGGPVEKYICERIGQRPDGH